MERERERIRVRYRVDKNKTFIKEKKTDPQRKKQIKQYTQKTTIHLKKETDERNRREEKK